MTTKQNQKTSVNPETIAFFENGDYDIDADMLRELAEDGLFVHLFVAADDHALALVRSFTNVTEALEHVNKQPILTINSWYEALLDVTADFSESFVRLRYVVERGESSAPSISAFS